MRRDSERSLVCHARTFSSGLGPYKKRLMECIKTDEKDGDTAILPVTYIM